MGDRRPPPHHHPTPPPKALGQERLAVGRLLVAGRNPLAADTMVLALLCARMVRSLSWLRGWPRRCMLLLVPNQAEETLESLRRDFANYEMLSGLADAGDNQAAKLCERSPFRLAATRQVVLALRATEWRVTDELRRFLRRKRLRLCSSQICEDGFNIMNNRRSSGARGDTWPRARPQSPSSCGR